MLDVKNRIKALCDTRGISVSRMLMRAGIQAGDYYQALKGTRTFFRGWRLRICQVLEVPETELFPEYQKPTEEV